MKTLNQLANEIDSALEKFDTEWKKSQSVWFLERRKALKEWVKTEEAEELHKRNLWSYYQKMYDLVGGKGNFQNDLVGFNRKLDRTIEARNTRIAHKIIKAGDDNTTVESGEIVHSNNGFNGMFTLNTSNGKKVITIDTFFAGGYNIQCAHLRTSIKIK
jgi:hypothetical protein